MKLLVIGLDSAEPSLVFEKWRDSLPALRHLMGKGVYGRLKSTIPPITVPAWTCMLTGKDPGEIGFYGFRNRRPGSYDLYIPNASHLREKAVYEILSDRGKTVVLIGVPQTYPPRKVRGIVVSSFLSPGKGPDFTYPPGIVREIDSIADGDYIVDVREFRTADKDQLLDQIYTMTERRFKVVKKFIKTEPWDFFMFVEIGVDRIHHGFWRFFDSKHRLYVRGNSYENAISDYYKYIDGQIGELVGDLPADVSIMVVSDHGAKRMEGAVAINDWLVSEGYLVLRNAPRCRVRLSKEMVDWRKTRVWAEGGYFARIFVNLSGREPEGVVRPGDYAALRDDIAEKIKAIKDEEGRPLKTVVYRPEEIYARCNGLPPDLIVYFDDLRWRAAGTVGNDSLHLFENDTGPDDANHAQSGIFIFAPARKIDNWPYGKGEELEGLEIRDVAATILDCLGLPVPENIRGRSLLRGERECLTEKDGLSESREYSREEEEAIKKRLSDLGYY